MGGDSSPGDLAVVSGRWSGCLKTFLVEELPAGIIDSADYAAKVSSAVVMRSGSIDESRDWLVVVPFRVDTDTEKGGAASSKKFVHDTDPMTFFLTVDGVPGVSGSIAFHANYEGRSEVADVVGNPTTKGEAVAAIRARFTAVSGSFSEVDASLKRALLYGVGLFRKMEFELDEPGIPAFEDDDE